MVWIGLAIIAATVWALIKGYEARLTLIASGFAMACIAMDPMAAFKGMSDGMTSKSMILNICSVMGFVFTMQYTQCDKHLGNALAKPLRHMQLFLIPGAAFVTFLVEIALPTAAGTAACVGAVVIPLLISLGVSPVMAASAVMMGTFGELLSPGMIHNAYITEIATKHALAHGQPEVSVMEVIGHNLPATLICFGSALFLIWLVGIVTKGYKGHADQEAAGQAEDFKVNYFYAILPLVPITLIVCCALLKKDFPALGKVAVPHCMLIGAALAMLVTRANPTKFSREFFNGMGKGYADVMGVIIGAHIMLGGMQATGLITAGENLMKSSTSLAGICAAVGPFVLAMITGSSNSGTMIFNGAITINAPDFGMSILDMGGLATLSGCLGRTCSPLASAAIICAGFSRLNGAMDMTKRTFIPAVLTAIIAYFAMLHL